MKAYLLLTEGETPDSAPPVEIIEFCKTKLAAFKVPRFITYVNEFPYTPTLKIAKHKLSDKQTKAWDSITEQWS